MCGSTRRSLLHLFLITRKTYKLSCNVLTRNIKHYCLFTSLHYRSTALGLKLPKVSTKNVFTIFLAGCCMSKRSEESSLIEGNGESRGEDCLSVVIDVVDNLTTEVQNLQTLEERHISDCVPAQDECPADVDIKSHNNQNVSAHFNEICCPDVLHAFSDEQEEPLTRLLDPPEKNTKATKKAQNKASKKRKRKREDGETKKTKLWPNYFVAMKITNPEIHNHLDEIQEHILSQDARLERTMISLEKLHITLMVMHIADNEELSRALKALQVTYDRLKQSISETPLELEFRGLGHFGNKVLFAKLSHGEAYSRLASFEEIIREEFEAAFLPSTDKRPFSPHLTVMKLSQDPRLFRKGIRKIDPALYAPYGDKLFGVQVIDGIQLLSMTAPVDDTGYYAGYTLQFDKQTS